MKTNFNPYQYKAEVKKVVDGDTFDILIDLSIDLIDFSQVLFLLSHIDIF